MIDEKYKWLYQYALPCTQGRESLFERLLKEGTVVEALAGDYSRENVRRHFLGAHNVATLDGIHRADSFHELAGYLHLAIPYQMKDIEEGWLICELRQPFYQGIPSPLVKREFDENELSDACRRGVLRSGSQVVITHAGIIAETCTLDDVAEFDEMFERQKS